MQKDVFTVYIDRKQGLAERVKECVLKTETQERMRQKERTKVRAKANRRRERVCTREREVINFWNNKV